MLPATTIITNFSNFMQQSMTEILPLRKTVKTTFRMVFSATPGDRNATTKGQDQTTTFGVNQVAFALQRRAPCDAGAKHENPLCNRKGRGE
jgi:hypothetical protein